MNTITLNNRAINYEVDKNNCWNCIGRHFDADGYPRIQIDGVPRRVHRILYMYLILKVNELSSDIVVRHKCDNVKCINPEHLIHGSQIDNIKDRDERMRVGHTIGIKNGNAKLSENDVVLIRSFYNSGLKNQRQLAEMFGVSQFMISRIIHNQNWNHI